MKKLQKITSYILATAMVLLASQYAVFAAGDNVQNESSLSAFQVVAGLAVLLLVILLPILKDSRKKARANR